MARPPKGKPLTLRPIRLDDDVWAECQRLGKEHGTINEGLRARMLEAETQPDEDASRSAIPETDNRPKNAYCKHCGSRFAGARFATICSECKSDGHTNDPRECPPCSERGTGQL